jgi:hypothetical protein
LKGRHLGRARHLKRPDQTISENSLDGSALAKGSEVFAGIEAEATEIADLACAAALVFGAAVERAAEVLGLVPAGRDE